MRFNQEIALRVVILAAGGIAAVVLAMKGHGPALPALAAGGMLGAYLTRLTTSAE